MTKTSTFLIICSGNYLEQGVERIVDQVVNPKVATVFIPQVEDLVYNYLGIPRKKTTELETTETKSENLLPIELEAVSPGSVKSNDDKNETMNPESNAEKMEIVEEHEVKEATIAPEIKENIDIVKSEVVIKSNDSDSIDKSSIPLPTEDIKLENIPAPQNSPPKAVDAKIELDSIALPHEPNLSTNIPLPEEVPKGDKEAGFKPIHLHSEDSSSSSDSSLRRNMSPLTPIRNYNNENSCDAQQGFSDSDAKSDEKTVPSSFRFTIESTGENNSGTVPIAQETKSVKNENDQIDLSYQFDNQVNINTFNTPMYDDSSNSNNLHIDYESDVNSKTNTEVKSEIENSQDIKTDKKSDRKSSHKSSHRSRDSSRHSSSKDKRSDSKQSASRDSSRHGKKSSARDEKSKSSKETDRSRDRSEIKNSRDSSKHSSSHKSCNKDKDSKSHRSSSSSHRQLSSKSSDERKYLSSSKNKDKHTDKPKDKSRDPKSSSNRDKERKSSNISKKSDDKDKKKDKKDIDDHYSSSGRGNHSRRSTDRDSNDGSSSSKGSQNPSISKSSENKKDSKSSSSKSETTSTSGESPSPSDKEHIVKDDSKISQFKPVIRVDNHLETPIAAPPRLPFVPDVTIKKPKFAANLKEAKKMIKMRKFLEDEQKRMNQEAALLLEFQANVRPNLSQVYSNISGPELEFACDSTPHIQDSYEVSTIQNVASLDTTEEEEINTEMEVENIPNAAQISEIIGVEYPINSNENLVLEEVIVEDISDMEIIEKQSHSDNFEKSTHESEDKNENTYDENKPFSELMDEITEYSKASEVKTKTDIEEKTKSRDIDESSETTTEKQKTECIVYTECTKITETKSSVNTENKYFEVTVIAEELSESEDIEPKEGEIESEIDQNHTIIIKFEDTEEKSLGEEIISEENIIKKDTIEVGLPKPVNELLYFAEHEKYKAELERHEFSNFLKNYSESFNVSKKIYLINCDTYEENIVKEVASTMGDFDIINYYKNGHLKLPNTTTNIIKDVPLTTEVILPKKYEMKSPLFSPVKSECSFELSSDYDTRLDEINKKSRQEVMEIILGSIIDTSSSKMPEIDYYSESTLEDVNYDDINETEDKQDIHKTEIESENLKRSIEEVESSLNNNRSVLTPKRMRKNSDSDHISSTTTEGELKFFKLFGKCRIVQPDFKLFHS